MKKVTKKAETKEVKKEVKVMTEKEVFAGLTKEVKEQLYTLIGQAYVTNKRVAIPKAIYDELNKAERVAVRSILDKAEAVK